MAGAALAENLSSVPSTHMLGFTTTCSSNYSQDLTHSAGTILMHTLPLTQYTYTHNLELK